MGRKEELTELCKKHNGNWEKMLLETDMKPEVFSKRCQEYGLDVNVPKNYSEKSSDKSFLLDASSLGYGAKCLPRRKMQL